MNISIPVADKQRLTPFQDFFILKTCLAVKGRRGSVGAGGAGSGRVSAMASICLSISSGAIPREAALPIINNTLGGSHSDHVAL